MVERKRSVRPRYVLGGLFGVLLAVAALDAGGFAVAQSGSTAEPTTESAEPRTPVALEGHRPNTPYSNAGATPFEALSVDAQDLIGRQGEWAETSHGFEVHQA